MDPLTTALHWVGDKVMGQLLDAMTKRVMGEVNPHFQQLERDLQQMRDSHEDVLVAPLREAMRFRELGDTAKAKEKLIEAEAKNPLAPIPRLMLAEMWCAEGRYDLVNKYLSEAVLLNPYCAAQYTSSVLVLADPAPGQLASGDETNSAWDVYLGDREFVETLATRFKWPNSFLKRFFSLGFAPRSTAAVHRASVCKNHIAVEWLLTDSLHHQPERVISLINIGTGHMEWARLNMNEGLQFATYRHVVVAKDDTFVLLDSATGQPVPRTAKMSRHYFESMFGTAARTPMFGAANWLATPPETAYDKSAHYFESHRAHHGTRGDPGTHRPALFAEQVMLRDPFRVNSPTVVVSNRWEHYHFIPGPNMFPTCWLIGGARLERHAP